MTGKKTGGRQKGTPNKLSVSLREKISEFVEDETESILEEIAKLEGREKLEMYFKLLRYVMPPMQATAADPSFGFSFVTD
jgi:hypothetical protein